MLIQIAIDTEKLCCGNFVTIVEFLFAEREISMKTKRILAGFLAILMFICMLPINTISLAEDSVKVYLSISKYGEFVKDKDNNLMAYVPIELTGKDNYTLDDVFKLAHDTYYDGEEGYASSNGSYGLAVNKLWGDESGNFGYQVNGGSKEVSGLSEKVSDGDYIDAYILKSSYPDSEAYSTFDKVQINIEPNQDVELTLTIAGYDENWRTVFSACEDATITINGEEQEITTDENGKVTLNFSEAGEYIVSAVKTKEINENTVTAITAPVCIVNVDEKKPTYVNNPIDVYIAISKYGEIIKDKNREEIAYLTVSLNGKESYNLNDVFKAAHDTYYNGENGYTASTNETYITKFWGDESGKFGYQVNSGSETVMGLGHEINDGDYIDICIYQNSYPDTENYTKFDKINFEVYKNQDLEITLSVAGYDDDWNMIFSACKDATITVNGEEQEIITDENGKATLNFSEVGEYIVSANKTKEIGENTVTAITAPVCLVKVKEKPTTEIIHNIAKKYASDKIVKDGNIYWFIADLADYLKLYPNSENVLSNEQKQACLDKIISFADTATEPGDLSKAIIALRALGYDAKNVYTSDLRKIDVVEKLTTLVDNKDSRVTNVYTLPYVIIALSQGEDYATEEQMNYLLNSALESKASWQATKWGTDALTPMITALSAYYDNMQNIKDALDEAITILRNSQSNNGNIGNASSTGLAIVAFSSQNIDSETVIKNEKSLIDGLLTYVNEDLDGFTPVNNSFSTEQGFRGLIAWQMAKNGQRAYDFKSNSMNIARATWGENCPITFEITPNDATVVIEGYSEISDKKFDLPEGEYNYSVSKSGYKTKAGVVVVTADEAENHISKTINVSLSKKASGSGSGSNSSNDEITVKIKVMIHNEDDCNNSYTYKKNSTLYTSIVNESVTVEKGTTVFDVLDEALTKNDIDYVEGSYGYISSIDGISEFDHGENSGWMFKIGGKHSDLGCREQELNKNTTVEWFFTDDYTKETGSESYSKTDSKTDSKKDETVNKEKEEVSVEKRELSETTFNDIKSDDWYYKAAKYVYENNIMDGTDEGFEPETNMTRAMLVTVLYKLETGEIDNIETKFIDVPTDEWYSKAVAWAVSKDLIAGVSEDSFAPNDNLTREQMALIIYKYAKLKGCDTSKLSDLSQFDDAGSISDWALEALKWANGCGLINGVTDTILAPQETATRAQVAVVIMKFCEMLVNLK